MRFPPPPAIVCWVFPHQLQRTVEVPLLDLPIQPEAARPLLHLVSPVRCLGDVSGISTSILPSCVGLILDEGIIFFPYQEINSGIFIDFSGIIPTYQGILS